MPVSTIKGVVSDTGGGSIAPAEQVIDMDDVIAYLDPEVSQFTTMLMQVAKKEAYRHKVEWLEDELFPRSSTLAAVATSADAALTLPAGEGLYFRKNDIVRSQTSGEAMLVTADGSSTSVPVARGIGSIGAASAASGGGLVIIGNASPRGAGLGTRLVTKRVNQFNFTQIQRNPYGFDNTLRSEKLYGGPEPDKERKKKLIEHKRAIEYTLFWGARALVDSTGSALGAASTALGACGGIVEFVSTNKKNANGVYAKTAFDADMKDILQHGSTNKVIFASPRFALTLSTYASTGMGINWGTTSLQGQDVIFGAKVDAWISGAYGFKIPVIVKRDWNDFPVTNNQYGSMAFVVDMDYVKMRPLRDTQLLRDRQANDSDTYDEEYLTEYSFELQHERAHGWIYGVTG
jgi:hypothetical protein